MKQREDSARDCWGDYSLARFSETQASIHTKNLSGDEVWPYGEKENGGRDFFDGSVALHGRFVREVLVFG